MFKGYGEGPGKSWNFKFLKGFESGVTTLLCQCISTSSASFFACLKKKLSFILSSTPFKTAERSDRKASSPCEDGKSGSYSQRGTTVFMYGVDCYL